MSSPAGVPAARGHSGRRLLHSIIREYIYKNSIIVFSFGPAPRAAQGHAPGLRRLAHPAEAHQRNVIVLAAAAGKLLDHLDDPLTKRPG